MTLTNGPLKLPTSGEALLVALKLGRWFLLGVWALVALGAPALVGGAVYITQLNDQVTAAVNDLAGVRTDIRAIKDELIPGAYVAAIHSDLKQEDRRLQVQIDRLEAVAAGRPYNHQGYEGKP